MEIGRYRSLSDSPREALRIVEIGGTEYCLVEREAIFSNPLYGWEHDRLGRGGWHGTKRLLPATAGVAAIASIAVTVRLWLMPIGILDPFMCIAPALLALLWNLHRTVVRWEMLRNSGMLRELLASGHDPFVLWEAFRRANSPQWWTKTMWRMALACWTCGLVAKQGPLGLVSMGTVFMVSGGRAAFQASEIRRTERLAGGACVACLYKVPLPVRLRASRISRSTAIHVVLWLTVGAVLVVCATMGGVFGAVIGGVVVMVILLLASFAHAHGMFRGGSTAEKLDPREAILRDIGE